MWVTAGLWDTVVAEMLGEVPGDNAQQPDPHHPGERAIVKPHAVAAAIGVWVVISPLVLNYPPEDVDVL